MISREKNIIKIIGLLAQGQREITESMKLLKTMQDDLADYVLTRDQKFVDALKKLSELVVKHSK